MYCKNCGRNVEDNSLYCNNCGTRLASAPNENASQDNPSTGFAIIGFLIPIIGLILYLIFESKKPKRAKSAGKGALIGVITKSVLIIFLVILMVSLSASTLNDILDGADLNFPLYGGLLDEETTDELLDEYVDVSFGEFEVSNNGYYTKTSLPITVKNKAEKQYSYYITIEAVDANGARIGTDLIYADRLGTNQEIYLTAFEYMEQEKISQFQKAEFRVLEIEKYDY